ncbi:MAG: glycosyltransferase family 9 protein [Pseudobdellovibrionaceae bacterium]
MKKIKELWPEQPLILICRQGVGEFFAKTRLVDEVLEVKKGDRESYRHVLGGLKHREIDKLISPHESLRTAFFAQKIKAQKKISFAKPWNGIFYNERVLKNSSLPDAIRQLSLLQGMDEELRNKIQKYSEEEKPYFVAKNGKLSSPPEWSSMSLRGFYNSHGSEVAKALAKVHLNQRLLNKSVALFPGSVWATKRWTEEGFIQVGQKLSVEGVSVLLMGGPGEEDLCRKIANKIPGALDVCAQTSIHESALILSQVRAVVGNDSASMHLAATSETPSVVIFGPTVLEFGFRPWQKHVYAVEKSELHCRPCGKHGHNKCPIKTHVCMKQISPDEVLEKLQGVLNEI